MPYIRQITKSNNRTKVIEWGDNLQANDFSEKTGVNKSSIHSKFSRIKIVIVDWTSGKKEKAVVVSHNMLPSNMKTIAELVIKNNFAVFEQPDKNKKQKGYLEHNINFYRKDEDGYSPVNIFNLQYQAAMNSPWTITITNGLAIASFNKLGGVSIKQGTYRKINTATVYLSHFEMLSKMIEVRDYIRTFETINMSRMLKCREEKENEEREKMEKMQQSS